MEPPIHQNRPPTGNVSQPPTADEPPGVVKQESKSAVATQEDVFEWFANRLGSESYGAPRVFDLFTLLAVTLAFALLFALLRVAEPVLMGSLPMVAISISVFATGIAIAQLALWGGNRPRIASLAAGPGLWLLISLASAFPDLLRQQDPMQFIALIVLSVLGVPAGYLGGGLVAGVFLLADIFRTRFMKQEAAPTDTSSAAIWEPDD